MLVFVVTIACTTMTGRTIVRTPEVPGAEFVGNAVCVDCHGEITRKFPDSVHGRFHKADMAMAGVTGCESCHGPGSLHVQTGGSRKGLIVNPKYDPSTCFECHVDVHMQYRLPNRHPVFEGQMNCVDCHDPHGGEIFKPSAGLAMARLNQSCARCHTEQTRPFIYEHEAMREGCVSCHEPHGSVNNKMLAERDANLCLKCHAQLASPDFDPGSVLIGREDHSFYLQMGTCWSAGCHTAVHGSNVNPKLLY